MSYYDYRISASLQLRDVPFYALIMAAARRADTENFAKLRRAWPDVVAELEARYNAPGGLLPDEALHTPVKEWCDFHEYCEECDASWPCPTIQALDGGE